MKKTTRKLELNRETVRNLSTDDLGIAAGGARTDDSCVASCGTVTLIQTLCETGWNC